MLETIDLSKTLPNNLKEIFKTHIGHLYGFNEVEKISKNKLLIMTEKDVIDSSGFVIVYVNTSENIKQEEEKDYFQPFKHNEQVGKINPLIFLNYVLGHIERLKLSPTIREYHETILTCD